MRSLKEGNPNSAYGVYIEWYNVDASVPPYTEGEAGSAKQVWIWFQYLGVLTTNEQGNGNFDTRLDNMLGTPLTEGTYHVQIAVGAGWNFKSNVTAVTIE